MCVIESVAMYELPLFPLNSVLFPGTPIHLHIFEERYKRMINLCLDKQSPFGVTLIRRGLEALGPVAEPHRVGVSAHIVHTEHLAQGRMNIIALGGKRFRLLSLDRDAHSYLTGVVEDYPLPDPQPQESQRRAVLLRQQLHRYVQSLVDAGVGQLALEEIPDDPLTLAYIAAALLQIQPVEKQELLTLGSNLELLDRLQTLYRREITLLQALGEEGQESMVGGFSRN